MGCPRLSSWAPRRFYLDLPEGPFPCSFSTEDPAKVVIPQGELAGYRVGQGLGSGAFGTVYPELPPEQRRRKRPE